MMKKLWLIITVVISMSFKGSENDDYPVISYESFTIGEQLDYKFSLGIFTIGKSRINISDKLYRINGRTCYKVDVKGKTSGLVDWVSPVDDTWGAYVDSTSLLPHISYRMIREGGYKKDELVKFDHRTNMIEYKDVNNDSGSFNEARYFQAPDNIRDLMGSYLFLRAVNFDTLNIGDTLTINSFFEDEFYDFQILYERKEELKVKAGRFNAIKLIPLMPDNKLFDGKHSIEAWFSDDKNRIPLKVRAKMFIGHAGVEIIDYQGLKNTPALIETID